MDIAEDSLWDTCPTIHQSSCLLPYHPRVVSSCLILGWSGLSVEACKGAAAAGLAEGLWRQPGWAPPKTDQLWGCRTSVCTLGTCLMLMVLDLNLFSRFVFILNWSGRDCQERHVGYWYCSVEALFSSAVVWCHLEAVSFCGHFHVASFREIFVILCPRFGQSALQKPQTGATLSHHLAASLFPWAINQVCLAPNCISNYYLTTLPSHQSAFSGFCFFLCVCTCAWGRGKRNGIVEMPTKTKLLEKLVHDSLPLWHQDMNFSWCKPTWMIGLRMKGWEYETEDRSRQQELGAVQQCLSWYCCQGAKLRKSQRSAVWVLIEITTDLTQSDKKGVLSPFELVCSVKLRSHELFSIEIALQQYRGRKRNITYC